MSKHVVRTPAALAKAKAATKPGDVIEFTAKRWARIVLDTGWKELTFTARDGATFAGFDCAGATNITMDSLEVTECDGIGILLRRGATLTTGLGVRNCKFHDTTDHFIAGAADNTLIQDCEFYRADRPGCEDESEKHEGSGKKCPEHIRIYGGGFWTIQLCRFGDASPNGPLMRIFPQSEYPLIHDVTVRANHFESAVHNQGGLDIEGSQRDRYPTNILVDNNTFLTKENGVGLGDSWLDCPLEGRPLVTNNHFRFEGVDQCARGRFFNNTATSMRGVCDGIQILDPHAN